jgi:hypothetical protein
LLRGWTPFSVRPASSNRRTGSLRHLAGAHNLSVTETGRLPASGIGKGATSRGQQCAGVCRVQRGAKVDLQSCILYFSM